MSAGPHMAGEHAADSGADEEERERRGSPAPVPPPLEQEPKEWATRFHREDGSSFLNNASGGAVLLYTRAAADKIVAGHADSHLWARVTVERGWPGQREACHGERVLLDMLPFVETAAHDGVRGARQALQRAREHMAAMRWGGGLTPPDWWEP